MTKCLYASIFDAMPRRYYLYALQLSLAFALLTTARAATVEYPAFGNLNFDEGTIELWLVPVDSTEPEPKPQNWKGIFRFLHIESPDIFTVDWTVTQKDLMSNLRVRIDDKTGAKGMRNLGNEKSPDANPQQGKLTHLAFTWKGREMAHYADGEFLGKVSQLTGFSGPIGNLMIQLGEKDKPSRSWLFQAIRISSVARKAEELANSSPVADASTLLLDRADQWQNLADGVTTPAVIALIHGQSAFGKLSADAQWQAEPAPGGLVLR